MKIIYKAKKMRKIIKTGKNYLKNLKIIFNFLAKKSKKSNLFKMIITIF